MYGLEANSWRILRRALAGRTVKNGVPFRQLRNWLRKDLYMLAQLIRLGCMEHLGGDRFRITSLGITAADLGEVPIEWKALSLALSPAAVAKLTESLSASVRPGRPDESTASTPKAALPSDRSGANSGPARMSGYQTAGRR